MNIFKYFPHTPRISYDETRAGFYRYADRLFGAKKLCLREGTMDKELMLCLINYVNKLPK
ncbi:MAG TPA: hypothetical protein VKS21_01050 [Spirochaetota bacterium]|nr:hypothetical protein [Spirochaetota bacterium]